jgi:uncharacterized protein YciI
MLLAKSATEFHWRRRIAKILTTRRLAATVRAKSPIFRRGIGMGDMKYSALIYYVVDDFVSRRMEFREDHLRLAWRAQRRGELLLAGAFTEPSDRALLVFRAAERSIVEDFARNDPYVKNGLVQRWEVRSWAVVVGAEVESSGAKGV